MELSSPEFKMQFTIGSKVKFLNLMAMSILAVIVVAGFASLLSQSKGASCKKLTLDPQCWIQRCQNFTEIQCNRVWLNLTTNEFEQFLAGACWSHTENTSCSITRELADKEIYHLEYTPEECGQLCEAF